MYGEKDNKIDLSFSTHFEVKEDEISNISAENLTIFDSFVEALGINEAYDKNTNFPATYSEGETIIQNLCELSLEKREIVK